MGVEVNPRQDPYLLIVLKNAHWIILLTVLLSCQSLIITASKENEAYTYNTSSTILLAEIVKLVVSSSILLYSGQGIGFRLNLDTLPYCVPALIYFIQNNMVFWALYYVDPTTYQILVNLKILTTGVLYRIVMRKELSTIQWAALVLLAVGCATSQLSSGKEALWAIPIPGAILCVILAFLSASAGIATEWIMKESSLKADPLHRQNVHLYFFGIIFNTIGYLLDKNPGEGFFDGYNGFTFLVVLAYSFVGLIVSVIMRYADNMVKIYAVAVSMMLTMVLSLFLFGYQPTIQLFFGIIIITISILMYFNILTANVSTSSTASSGAVERRETKVVVEDEEQQQQQHQYQQGGRKLEVDLERGEKTKDRES